VAVIGVVFVFVNSGVVIPVVSPVVVFIVIIIEDDNIIGLRCRRSGLWGSRPVCRWFLVGVLVSVFIFVVVVIRVDIGDGVVFGVAFDELLVLIKGI
jgi:hypothetical protein